MKYRKRYLIAWVYNGGHGRDHWVMERRGKLSSSDIKRLEYDIAEKWGFASPVTIVNFDNIN
jgi:hypothetical protein